MQMLAEERFSLIMEQLNRKRTVTVQQLCEALHTSESTIRRDLTQLDRQGLLKKVHGGATLVGRTVLADEPPMAAREEQSVEEKRLIARAAAAMITEKDFVFLDAGSTTLALAAAHFIGFMVKPVAKPNRFQSAGSTRHTFFFVYTGINQRQRHINLCRKFGQQIKILKYKAYFRIARMGQLVIIVTGNIAPAQKIMPAGGPVKTA